MTEFIVAMVLFGLALAGLFPMIVMQSRVIESLEQRPEKLSLHRDNSQDSHVYREAHPTEWYKVTTSGEPDFGEWVHRWYLVPFSDAASTGSAAWARKLGAGASLRYAQPVAVQHISLDEPTNAEIVENDAAGGGANPNYAESTSPDWTDQVDANALNGSQRRPPTDAAGTAAWTFTVANAGWYQIQATGLVAGSAPPGCSYTLIYAGIEVPIAIPSTLQFGANQEPSLLATKYLPAGSVTLQLTADATNVAIADGVRIVRCSLQIQSVTSDAGNNPTAIVEIKPAILAP